MSNCPPRRGPPPRRAPPAARRRSTWDCSRCRSSSSSRPRGWRGACSRGSGSRASSARWRRGLILGPSVLRAARAVAVGGGVSGGRASASSTRSRRWGCCCSCSSWGSSWTRRTLRRRGRTALLTSHASIVAPFLLGPALALGLYPRLAPAGVAFTPFALFVGAAMSVTAFPVLARILADRGMTTTPLGAMAHRLRRRGRRHGVVHPRRGGGDRSRAPASRCARAHARGRLPSIVAIMFALVRPLLARVAERREPRPGSSAQTSLAIVMLLALSSAWATERLGIHALFGAFLLGALLPHVRSRWPRRCRRELRGPDGRAAAARSSSRSPACARGSLISSAWLWLVCGLVILVAIASGSSAGPRSRRAPRGWRGATRCRSAR